MESARSLTLGWVAAALTVAVGLVGLWFFLLTLAFVRSGDAIRTYLVAPAVLLALGAVVMAALALAPDSMAFIAAVEAAAAVTGLVTLTQASSAWAAPTLIMLGIPPTLLLVAFACALAAVPSSTVGSAARPTEP